jgi:hypothetical protein
LHSPVKRRYSPTRVATETDVPSTAGTAYAISRVMGLGWMDAGFDEEGRGSLGGRYVTVTLYCSPWCQRWGRTRMRERLDGGRWLVGGWVSGAVRRCDDGFAKLIPSVRHLTHATPVTVTWVVLAIVSLSLIPLLSLPYPLTIIPHTFIPFSTHLLSSNTRITSRRTHLHTPHLDSTSHLVSLRTHHRHRHRHSHGTPDRARSQRYRRGCPL